VVTQLTWHPPGKVCNQVFFPHHLSFFLSHALAIHLLVKDGNSQGSGLDVLEFGFAIQKEGPGKIRRRENHVSTT
jgi:hypothetical protein